MITRRRPARARTTTPPCPTPAALVRYVGPPAREVAAIIAHVERCERCRRRVVAAVRAARGRDPA